MPIEPATLGKAIKKVRTIRGLTQKEVAEKARLTVNYLSLVETGERSITTESLNAIAEALEVPTQWISFLGGEVQALKRDRSQFREVDEATKNLIVETIQADTELRRKEGAARR